MCKNLMLAIVACTAAAAGVFAQTFEVATIKPTPLEDYRGARYIRMESVNRFIAKNYTVKGMIGAAYNLSPEAISGGPGWVESDRYEIVAGTPGDVKPTLDRQMSMLQNLLADRFKLTFHRQQKEFSIYVLTVAKGGSKLKESTAPPEEPPALISTVFPGDTPGIDHLLMPGRNATATDFASVLQRAILDRPVVDKTGLAGKYDFDLEWTPDDTQFGGQFPASADASKPHLMAAIQEQLGLRLEATRGPIDALVIDLVERPSAN